MVDKDQVRQCLRTTMDETLDNDIAKNEAGIMAVSSVIAETGGEMHESPIFACHVVALGMLSLKRLVAEHDARLAAEIAAMGGVDVEKDHVAADDMLQQIAKECGYVKTAEAFGKLTKWYA